MGGEFGQKREWQHDESLEWHVLQYPLHAGVQRWLGDLNRCYRTQPALYEKDFSADGFAWIDFHDWEESIISFLRHGRHPEDTVLAVFNFTPLPRLNYVVGVPNGGYWQEILNSDAGIYAGSGMGNMGGVEAAPVAAQGHHHSLALTLPPLSVVYLKVLAAHKEQNRE
jgi:1,4-alpha-glucan branching enzyme